MAADPRGRLVTVSPRTWIKLVYSALFAICIAYTIWYAAVREIGSARTSVYSNLLPIVAMLTALCCSSASRSAQEARRRRGRAGRGRADEGRRGPDGGAGVRVIEAAELTEPAETYFILVLDTEQRRRNGGTEKKSFDKQNEISVPPFLRCSALNAGRSCG